MIAEETSYSLIHDPWVQLLFVLAVTAYLFYYSTVEVKRPLLACGNESYRKFLINNIPSVTDKYWPLFWCLDGPCQSVLAFAIRTQMLPEVDYRREIFTLSDGGEVALDWLETDCGRDTPCIIILPGLSGESGTDYIRYLALAGNRAGFRVVVFQYRGVGVDLKTPKYYCASKCEDVAEVIRHTRETLPNVKLGAIGVSMGGLMLGNYFVQYREEAKNLITSAISISVPYNVPKGATKTESSKMSFLLGRYLIRHLCDTIIEQKERNADVFDGIQVDFHRLQTVKTIREFDQVFTSKHFGYSDVNAYYADATLHNKISQVTVPLLCLSAADDPFHPFDGIPMELAEQSSHVAILVTGRGGHVGFLESWLPWGRQQFMERLLSKFFCKTLVDRSGEFELIRTKMNNKISIPHPRFIQNSLSND